MSDNFSLRCYCYIDRMQAQYAAFVGTVTQGDLPTEGMAALYVEMAPGNEVFRVVDIAVKATEARPGARSSNASSECSKCIPCARLRLLKPVMWS